MLRLKNIKRINGSLFNCDLYPEDEQTGYNVNLDYNKWEESMKNIENKDLHWYAAHAMQLIEWYEERGIEVPEEDKTAWY